MSSTIKIASALLFVTALSWLGISLWDGVPSRATESPGLPSPALAAGPGAEGDRVIETAPPESPAAPREVVGAVVPSTTVSAEGAPAFPLRLGFVRPDRSALVAEDVRVRLVALDSGRERLARGDLTGELAIPAVSFGSYELQVEARGVRHVAETFTYRDERDLENGGDTPEGDSYFFRRVTLWPPAWVPVVILTDDGRPFSALAEDAGLEPKRWFVDAFTVRVGREPRDAEDATRPLGEPKSDTEPLALFRPAPGYQNVEISAGIAGSLELARPLEEVGPLWVDLWLFGRFFQTRSLHPSAHPGERAVEFSLALADLEERFATVALRVVDADSGAPVVDATATCKANTSAHRRADLAHVTPDLDGRMSFSRVVPGDHELTVTRGGHVAQRQVTLEPGQHADQGDIPIGAGPGIRLVVLGEDGEPVMAWIEIAPYEPGAAIDDLYHPNLHRMTDRNGVYDLPLPDRPSIVRARPLALPGSPGATGAIGARYYGPQPVGTRNLRVSPDEPALELVLRARPRVPVTFEPGRPWEAGHSLCVLDELGLVIAFLADGEALHTELVAGAYRVERRDGEHELGAVEVQVSPASSRVPVP